MDIARAFKRQLHLNNVTVQVPWVGSASFSPDDTEERVAWALYVELSTRVAIESIDRENGSLREALTSIYHLFGAMRVILRDAGAGVGRKQTSLGRIAINVMNNGIRPYLTKWHNALKRHEAGLPQDVTNFDWEREWTELDEFYEAMDELKAKLEEYRKELGRIAGLQ